MKQQMKNLNRKLESQPEIDEKEWEEAVKDVQKLPQPPELPNDRAVTIEIKPVVNVFEAYQGETLSNLEANFYAGIDKQTLKKFKREEYPVEAVLDLHGQTEKNAHTLVCNFIQKAYAEQKRCVIIITGKGNMHKEQEEDIFASRGILKYSVPNWLYAPELRPLILSYRYPSEAKGGKGALYILLRRRRKN